ncbi:MAG: sulfatase-like hydrolase/transferase, partial [Coraliomargarita sp.]
APAALIDRHVERYRNLGYAGLKRERHQGLIDAGVFPATAPFPELNTVAKQWDALSDAEKDSQARIMATYAAMIESQDFYIGRVLDYLRETGQLENTLVFYMPDNGPEGADAFGPLSNSLWVSWVEDHFDMSDAAIGSGGSSRQIGLEWANASTGSLQWWKWFVAGGGARVPLIVRPPAGSSFDLGGELTSTTLSVKDVPMTILSYAEIEHPGAEYKGREVAMPSGISMRPFLEGQSETVRAEDDWFAFELFGNGFVIQGDYKVMKLRKGMYGDGQWHLYNIVQDPGETTPLEGKMPDRFRSMMALYRAYEKEFNIVPVAEDWNPWKAAGE